MVRIIISTRRTDGDNYEKCTSNTRICHSIYSREIVLQRVNHLRIQLYKGFGKLKSITSITQDNIEQTPQQLNFDK